MGDVRLTVSFEVPDVDWDLSSDQLEQLSGSLNQAAGETPSHQLSWQERGDGRVVAWVVTWVIEERITAEGDAVSLAIELEHVGRALSSGDLLSRALAASSRYRSTMTFGFRNLRTLTPRSASLSLPVRHGDAPLFEASIAQVLREAAALAGPFEVDLERDLADLEAKFDGRTLRLAGPSMGSLADLVAAYLRAPRDPRTSALLLPPARRPRSTPALWPKATALILLATAVLAWFPLTDWTLGLLGAATLLIAVATLFVAGQRDRGRKAAIGLFPVLLLVGFALIYGFAALHGSSVSTRGRADPKMVDALLLSLSLASTVGFLDLVVSGWARSVAYIEMLLVAGYLGSALVIVLRDASQRFDGAIAEVLSQRRRSFDG